MGRGVCAAVEGYGRYSDSVVETGAHRGGETVDNQFAEGGWQVTAACIQRTLYCVARWDR